MRDVLCSTGALIGRPNNRNFRLLADCAEALDCDGFEFMVYESWYPDIDEVIGTVKSYKLNIPVIHCHKALSEKICGAVAWHDEAGIHRRLMTEEEDKKSFEEGLEEFKLNLRIAGELGADKMVFHLWNGIVSDMNIDKNAERFLILKDMAEKAGVLLMVENVICNGNDPLYNMNVVYEKCRDVAFVYDTKMAEFHGQTMDIFTDRWNWMLRDGHVKHLHVNDYGGGFKDFSNLRVLPVGKGHVDFERFFSELSAYDYDGDFTVESTAFDLKTGELDFDMLNRCFADVRRLAGL